ncbi:MAG TPA: histidine kinase [Nevskiaceae bacterium]
MANGSHPANDALSVIPEFCRGPALAVQVLVMELVAVVLTVVGSGDAEPGTTAFNLFMLSIYLQWMGACCAIVLCLMRRWLRVAPIRVVFFACWALLMIVIGAVSEMTWQIMAHLDLGITPTSTHSVFLLRSLVVGAIVSLLLLHYFWDRYQWREQIRTEANAHYLALQARIRPHFLFNALNSLAALIRIRPQQAEDMVLDLSDLFRASLNDSTRLISLREELEIVRGYLRIEEVRLGGKLHVVWNLPDALLDALVPRLILQPLVENAVLHGVSRREGGGMLTVNGAQQGGRLVIDVENPLPPAGAPEHSGTGVATGNIRERLRIMYGNAASLELAAQPDDSGGIFRARLALPLQRVESPVAEMSGMVEGPAGPASETGG